MFKAFNKIFFLLTGMLVASPAVWAAGPPKPSSMENPMVLFFVILMVILLLVIAILANVIVGAAGYVSGQEKELEKEEKKNTSAPTVLSTIAAILLFGSPVLAQDAAPAGEAAAAASSFSGISPLAFSLIIGVVALEMIVILAMLIYLRNLLARRAKAVTALTVKAKEKEVKAIAIKKESWWSRINKFKPVEEEADIELDHNYDGIRELDNRLPPWWLYGFYITIIFAVVYLWRYHVAESAPLSEEEFKIAMQKAEVEKQAYLKKTAGNIDENNIKLLTEAIDMEAGKKIYEQSCTPCHGKNGEGVVGPNLTDPYWLHGGSVSDVFKSVKYGWPEKGMRAWKDDFSPKQMAQLTSFIISLNGTNPANAKQPEGSKYEASDNGGAAKDSASSSVAVVN